MFRCALTRTETRVMGNEQSQQVAAQRAIYARCAAGIASTARIDPEQLMGVWHEVASKPTPFQRSDAYNTTATYSNWRYDERTMKLTFDVVNREMYRDERGEERENVSRGTATQYRAQYAPNALCVEFAPSEWPGVEGRGPPPGVMEQFYAANACPNYNIVLVHPDLAYIVVASRNGEFLWVLSRAPGIGEEDYDEIVTCMNDVYAFDVSTLRRRRHAATDAEIAG